MKKNLSIAVLITCYNRKELSLKCLRCLYLQKGLNEIFDLDVFLVDDCSNDGTYQAIKSHFPKVNIILGNGSLFWNRGMCLAWETAFKKRNFDFYLWLNDDTFIFEYALLNLLDSVESTFYKAVIVGSTFSYLNNKISYGGNNRFGKRLIPNGHLQEVYTFNGNIVLVPDYVFRKVGFLDKKYPHAIGDFDYALRVRQYNLKSYITKNFEGACDGNDDLPIWCYNSTSLINRFKNLYSPKGNSHPYYYFIFECKHYGYLTAIKHFITIHIRLLFPSIWN
jgi:GT2 family glycosyltransferase